MKKCMIIGLAIANTVLTVRTTTAQFTCTGTQTNRYEIFIEVLSTVQVKITNLETSQVVFNSDVSPNDNDYPPNPSDEETCDWFANVGDDPYQPWTPDADLDWKTPYKIEIGNKVYTYYNCAGLGVPLPSTDGFYCPNVVSGYSPSKSDMYFLVTNQNSVQVIFDAMRDEGDWNTYFTDSYWMAPYNMDAVCGSNSSCLSHAMDLNVLVTPQEGPTTYTITNKDLTLASGATWDFYGKTLKFQSGKKFNVFGTLDLENTTLTAAGSYWNGLYFGSGSNGTVTSSSILKVGGGPGNSAVSIYNAGPTIGYSNIEPNYGYLNYGVTFTGSNQTPLIHHSDLTTGYAPVVYVSGSNNQMNLHANHIDQPYSQPAVAAVSSGRSYFWGGLSVSYVGYNEIRGGKLLAVSGAVIDAGSGPTIRGYNDFCDSNASSLEADAGGVIYARYDYWYDNQDPVQNNHSGSGTIYYTNKLGAASCSGFEAVAKTSGFESEAGDEGDARLFDARYLISRGFYPEGYALLQAVIENGSPRDARAALLEVGALYPLMKTAEVKSLASDFAATTGDLQLAGRQVLAGMHVVDGRLDLARDEYERIASSRDVDRRSILDAKVSIASLLISEDEYEKAKQILASLEPAGEQESGEIALWNEILRIEEENYTAELLLELDRLARLGKADSASTGGQEVTSVDVYPNPFNPTTTIRYNVQIEGPATIDVFDALGRRVTTLVRSVQAAGTHQVVFDAAGLPTGMYLYRIETAAGVAFGKMVLAK